MGADIHVEKLESGDSVHIADTVSKSERYVTSE